MRHLSAAERIQLAEDLWDSVLHEGEDLPLAPGHREELERRLALLDSDSTPGEPWEVVRDRLMKLL